MAAIKSTIESLRALLRGEWTFEEVVFTDEQLAEFRRQGRFGFDRTRGAGDEGARSGMSAEQEEPEAPTEGVSCLRTRCYVCAEVLLDAR